MAYVNGPKGIVTDGLVVYYDPMNYKSYTSGSTNLYNIVNPGVQNATIVASQVQIGNVSGYPFYTYGSGGPSQPILVTGTESIDFDRSSSFTMCAWASVHDLTANTTNNSRGIWSRGSYGGYVGIHAQKQTSESAIIVRIGTRGLGTIPQLNLNPDIRTGSYGEAEIFYAVMVYTSASMSGYWNGEYVGIQNTNVEAAASNYFTGSYAMNRHGGIGGNAQVGTMSIYNVSMYNRALSAEEIKRNYEAQKGRLGL